MIFSMIFSGGNLVVICNTDHTSRWTPMILYCECWSLHKGPLFCKEGLSLQTDGLIFYILTFVKNKL